MQSFLRTMAGQLVELTTPSQQAPFALQILFAFLSTLAVILRIIARRKKHLPLQWDDYLIVIALVGFLSLEDM